MLLIFIWTSHFARRQTIQNEDNEGIMKELFIFMTDSKRKEPKNQIIKKKKKNTDGMAPVHYGNEYLTHLWLDTHKTRLPLTEF